MRTVFFLFDSLVRDYMPSFGGDKEALPNFARLENKSTRFTNHWVGSLPCMPARRDLHTGRLNFFHRPWGPLEPYDDSFVTSLRNSGVYTHLVTDHYHYFEEGGANYHTRYNSWELFRGQETDTWRGIAEPSQGDIVDEYDPLVYDMSVFKNWRHAVNRSRIREDADFPGHKCLSSGLQFLQENADKDSWLLHLELFDPHEPFHAPEEFLQAEGIDTDLPIADWPSYGAPDYDAETADRLQRSYRALLRYCDHQLGRLLDHFDAENLWDDTTLIVTTDHGFLLSEHGYWGKSVTPLYNEIARIPLYIHTPGQVGGKTVDGLSQATDIAPTILDLYDLPIPPDVTGKSLLPALTSGKTERDSAVFGIFGRPICCTDGQHVAFFVSEDTEYLDSLHLYTMMPADVKTALDAADLRKATFHPPLAFTKGMPVWKIPADSFVARGAMETAVTETMLFDLKSDPGQHHPIEDAPAIEERLRAAMLGVLQQHDAPSETQSGMAKRH